MVVRFRKCVLKIDEIHKDEISLENFLEYEREVIRLVRWWKSSEVTLQFKTSGSTGAPKSISMARSKMEYSAEATMQKLDPAAKFQTALLCINPSMIGGAMLIFRALHRNLDLTVLPPASNPLPELKNEDRFDLVSLVPIQMNSTNRHFWDRFNTILVGGADFPPSPVETTAKIYATFGMTETVSHFALRQLGEEYYECIGDTELEKQSDDRLKIKGALTENKWLLTNDLIEFISPTKFSWKGRVDFLINSGGIKMNPEKIEAHLKKQLTTNFIISSIPDPVLGNRLILIIEGNASNMELDYSGLPKYERPKATYFIRHFAKTQSSKIDRIGTQEMLKKQLNIL